MAWLNKQWSKLDFWDKEENERQKQQFAKPTPQTKPAVPQSVELGIKNAKFGVLANNPQRQKSFLNDLTTTQTIANPNLTNARKLISNINNGATDIMGLNRQKLDQKLEKVHEDRLRQAQQSAIADRLAGRITGQQAFGRTLANAQAPAPKFSDTLTPSNKLGQAGMGVINTASSKQVAPVVLGIRRSAIGTGEGLSGLYDLATPGKGTNRFGKSLIGAGARTDQAVKQGGYNNLAYKGAQAGTDLATFAAGGTPFTKGVGKITTAVGKKAPTIVGAVSKGADALADTGKLGKAVVAGGKYIARPDVLSDVISDAAMNAGLRSNRGGDINAGTIATDVGMSVGMGGALGLTTHGAGALIKKATNGIENGSRLINRAKSEVATGLNTLVSGKNKYSGVTRLVSTSPDTNRMIVSPEDAGRVIKENLGEMGERIAGGARRLKNDEGGFIAGPLAGDFSEFKKAGKVFDGPDGKPRFEVDDSGAKLNDKEFSWGIKMDGKPRKVGQILEHDKLFEQYPELKDVNVRYEPNDLPGHDAHFDPDTNTIVITKSRADKSHLSDIVHELQHSIQEREGFAGGGAPKYRNYKAENASIKRGLQDVNTTLSGKNLAPEQTQRLRAKRDNLIKQLEQTQDQYGNVFTKAKDIADYRKLAGEAEARAVQARMNMPMSERYVSGINPAPEKSLPDMKNEFDGLLQKIRSRTATDADSQRYSILKDRIAVAEGKKGAPNPERWVADKPIKLPDVVYRGTSKDSGSGFAMFGGGKYTAASKAEAAKYGTVQTLGKESLPSNPLQFKTTQDFSQWEYEMARKLGVNKNELYDTNKGAETLINAIGHDGVTIGTGKDLIAVKFSPETISEYKPRSTFYDSLDVPKKDLIVREGGGKAMSVEKPTGLKAEAKAPKVPRGNIEEAVIKGENMPLEIAPAKSIGQLQATSRLPKDKKLRKLELDQLGATKITPNKPSQKITEAEFNSLLDTAEAQNPNLKTKKAVEIATKPKREQQLKAVMEGDLETSNKLRQEIAEVKDGTLKSAPDMNKVFDNEDLGKVELKDIKGRANKQTKQKFMTRANEYLGEKQAGRFRATDSARTFNEQFGDLTDAQKLQVIEGADNPELRTTDNRVNQAIDSLHKEYDTAYRYYTKDKNINMGYQSSYYPRMYKNPATGEAIDSATFQLLQKASSRQKGRTADQIATDFLITKDPAEALQKYHASLESAAAGKKFLQDLQKDGLVMQSTEPVRGMQPIVAEGMQDAGTIYYAKPEVAKSLNKMFGNQEASGLFENLMEKGAGLNSFVQSFVLSGGVPNTPLNAFGVMQVMKHTMAGHPIQAAKAFHKGMSRGGADKFFRANSDAMQQLAKQGYTIRVDYDPAYKSGSKRIAEAFKDSKAKGLNEGWDQFTNDATFKRFMPAMEVLHFKGVRDGLIKRGVPQEQAIKQAADATGNFFGKTKVATEATRSKVGSDAAGAFLFAPRFRESMINFWGRNIKALNPKNIGKVEYRDNQKFLVAAAITYATMEGLNKSLTGEWMHDNPDGKKDKLLIPADKLKAVGIDTKGKDIGIPFLPSIATVPRNAVSGIYNLATGNTKEAGKNLQSFLSMPVKTANELLTNENYFGRQIVDEDATTPEKLSQAASHIVSSNMQPWIREGLNMAGQKLPEGTKKALGIKQKSGVETASNALELPFRFYDPNYYKKGDEYINRQGKDASVKRDGKYVKVSDLPLGQRFQESLKNLGKSDDSDYVKRNVAEIDSEMNKIYQKYGLTPTKTTTAVAKKWAEYDNRLKDGKISPLKQPAEERKLLRDTYKLQAQGATRDFLSVSSDNDMRQAIKDGLVDKKTLESAIELDNFLVANGLQTSPTIGKKLRSELGYSTPGGKKVDKKSVARGRGNKKIIDDMIKAMLASSEGKSKLNKNLRTLIEGLSKKEYAKAKKVTV